MNLPWLYDHRCNVASQHGEDGLVDAIFSRIGIETPWCVDIGANDGVTISNTHYWCGRRGWAGVLVEANSGEFCKLCKVYAGRDDVHCVNEFVSADNPIDAILARTPIPERFDLISIDVDGMDFWLWQAMERYRPRVVVIEVNASMAPDLHLVQNDPSLQLGSSALAMVTLAREKGYELAAHLVSNCIFVDRSDFGLLGISDNSLESLFTSPFVPTVVSDLQGVHHILKPGPWGFSGARLGPGQFASEGGQPLAKRLVVQARHGDGSVMRFNPDGSGGFSAALRQDGEMRRIAHRFLTEDWSAERAALEAGQAAEATAPAE